MKKTLTLFFVFVLYTAVGAFAETNFQKALTNCSSYSQKGAISYEGVSYPIEIYLQKSKGDICTYKEKIYLDDSFELLTCNFNKNQLQFVTNSMKEYSELIKGEIAKNKIFEAKLTSNGVIFQKYLIEPNICKITTSVKQK